MLELDYLEQKARRWPFLFLFFARDYLFSHHLFIFFLRKAIEEDTLELIREKKRNEQILKKRKQ